MILHHPAEDLSRWQAMLARGRILEPAIEAEKVQVLGLIGRSKPPEGSRPHAGIGTVLRRAH